MYKHTHPVYSDWGLFGLKPWTFTFSHQSAPEKCFIGSSAASEVTVGKEIDSSYFS
jgi:hypothetical protein